jgi:dienelactone hydrolase
MSDMTTTAALHWLGETKSERGVDERRFDLHLHDRVVPGVLLTPTGAIGARPIVGVGHGGTNHKKAQVARFVSRRLARRGLAAVAIDAPFHGDRDDPTDRYTVETARSGKHWDKIRDVSLIDVMVEDWTESIAACQADPAVGDGPIGYWGWSLGTHFGLPFVGSGAPVAAASLGLYGTNLPRHGEAAAAVTCPVLFTMQWHDELVPRESAFDLFDRLGVDDKRLVAHPGKHVEVPRPALDESVDFLADRLVPSP